MADNETKIKKGSVRRFYFSNNIVFNQSLIYFTGGFEEFEKTSRDLCEGTNTTDESIYGLCNLKISDDSGVGTSESDNDNVNSPSPRSQYPVKVLPYLYLGNAQNSADLNQLKKFGIKYILNVTPNVPNKFEMDSDFKYLQIPVADQLSQNLSAFFPQAIAFIGRYTFYFMRTTKSYHLCERNW